MLTFILGPSGSGKSRRMLAELRARAENGQRSLLIVPEQFTSSTEGTLYHILGDSLSAYVESYSFTSLAEALLRRYGGAAVETLSEAGRALLVRRAADSLLDKVVYYNRQRRSAAFCEKAAQTIEELKSAGITPDQLAAYARLPGADQEKLEELSLIYGSYEAQLAQTAMDPGDRQQLAAQMLDARFFAGRAVYMDEFDTFNAPKRALLAAMLPVADVTVCLCCDGEQDTAGGMGLFSGVQRVIAGLKRMAADANVPTRTVVLTEDKRHAGVPALAEPAAGRPDLYAGLHGGPSRPGHRLLCRRQPPGRGQGCGRRHRRPCPRRSTLQPHGGHLPRHRWVSWRTAVRIPPAGHPAVLRRSHHAGEHRPRPRRACRAGPGPRRCLQPQFAASAQDRPRRPAGTAAVRTGKLCLHLAVARRRLA